MRLQKHRDSSDALVQAAKEYIEAHCLEKFSLKKISGDLFVNGSYLLRLFKSQTGQTLLEYHNRVRCDKAKELLLNTRLCISEIAEAVGFVSSAHFSHVFKKITDSTPTSYRESVRGEKSPEGMNAG
ncbi:MAG: helix-turn-helix transcriptional regulator [Clostridia bacterium]|nr:helix-turn-helix transcriptional regulator [Clostridia bacterium]